MEHRILGGSDFFLMPSRYEPCGLTQMHAQRYGALPIAHSTGGLTDTIDDGRTGFLFSEFSGDALRSACDRAFNAYAEEDRLDEMRLAAMAQSFSWSAPAAHYRNLFDRLIDARKRPRHAGTMQLRPPVTPLPQTLAA
jgi:starch synthase